MTTATSSRQGVGTIGYGVQQIPLRIGLFLIRMAPVVWQTRVLPVVAIAAVGYAIAYLAGSATPVSLRHLPTFSDVNAAVAVIYSLAGATALYWAFLLRAFRLGGGAVNIALAFVLHLVSASFLLMVPAGYVSAIAPRIADLVTDDAFASEYTISRANGFWNCSLPPTEGLPIVNGLGADVELSSNYAVDEENACPDGATVVSYSTGNHGLLSPLLMARLTSVGSAKGYVSDHRLDDLSASTYRDMTTLANARGFVALVSAVLLTMMSLRFTRPRAHQEDLKSRVMIPVVRLRRGLRRYGERFAEAHPIAWAARLHVTVPLYVIVSIAVGLVMVVFGGIISSNTAWAVSLTSAIAILSFIGTFWQSKVKVPIHRNRDSTKLFAVYLSSSTSAAAVGFVFSIVHGVISRPGNGISSWTGVMLSLALLQAIGIYGATCGYLIGISVAPWPITCFLLVAPLLINIAILAMGNMFIAFWYIFVVSLMCLGTFGVIQRSSNVISSVFVISTLVNVPMIVFWIPFSAALFFEYYFQLIFDASMLSVYLISTASVILLAWLLAKDITAWHNRPKSGDPR